jgi:hypothetical protein
MLNLLRRVAAAFALLGSVAALGAALLVVASVTLRALTSRPIQGDFAVAALVPAARRQHHRRLLHPEARRAQRSRA